MSERNGYVWLWRQATDSEVWVHEGMWKLWTLCLMLANWKPKHEGGLDLERGQFITGRYHLHAAYHRGNRKWRTAKPCAKTLLRWLRTLENMGNLSLNVSTLGTVVTICNWKRYQPELDENVHESVQRVSSECPSDVQPVSTPNKDKNDNNEKKEKKTTLMSEVVDAWNLVANEWPRLAAIRSLSGRRKAHLKARLQEPLFRDNYARIFTKVADNDFLRGDKGNWRADFDWLIKNDGNYLKVLEGKYSQEEDTAKVHQENIAANIQSAQSSRIVRETAVRMKAVDQWATINAAWDKLPAKEQRRIWDKHLKEHGKTMTHEKIVKASWWREQRPPEPPEERTE